MSTCDFNCTNTRDMIQTRTAWECRWHFHNSLATWRWPSASLGWKSFIDWKADRESRDIKILTNIDFVFDRRLYKGKVTMGRSLRYQCNGGRRFTSSMLLRWKGARLRWQCFRTVYLQCTTIESLIHHNVNGRDSRCRAPFQQWSEWCLKWERRLRDFETQRSKAKIRSHWSRRLSAALRLVVRVEKKLITREHKSIDISTITVPVTRVAALTNSEAAWTTYRSDDQGEGIQLVYH